MKKQKKSRGPIISRKKVLIIYVAINIFFLLIPSVVTLTEMGWFSQEQKVTTEITASEDAPVLRIVADEGFRPRAYVDKDGNWAGADVEVAIEAANRLGMRPEIVFSDWITARDTVISGDADIILGLEIFSNMEAVNKTIPISNDKLNVYGRTRVMDAASLAGKKVGLMAQSVIISMFELNCEYVEFYTNTEILQALADGEVDFAICHGSIAQSILKDKGLDLEECFTLMESYPAIGVREDAPELRESLNSVLREMADDGTIQELERKWVTSSRNYQSFANVIRSNGSFYIGYFAFVMIAEFMLVVYIMQSKHYSRSMEYNEKIKEQYRMLTSMAEIYVSMHLINLIENQVTEFSSKDFIRICVTADMSVQEQMKSIMMNTIVPEMQKSALEFTDLNTLPERMGQKRVISKEFLGTHVGWIRAQFVAVSYEEKGQLSEVVFTTLSIDHEKEREQYLLHISNIDELTGLYNRRAYETDLEELRGNLTEDMVIVSFDLNGLKQENDKQGHQAGDKMLREAAKCISEVFDEYGKVYRVGGDEFMSLIHLNYKEMPSLKEKLLQRLQEQSQKTGIPLSMSCGYATYAENRNAKIEDLVMNADKNMYQEKAAYYKMSSYNRRE